MKLRYQHVYNVLLKISPPSGEVAAPADIGFIAIHVDSKGKVQLPTEFLAANGLEDGGTLFCRNDRQGLTLMSRESALDHLREVARKRMPDQAALLDALLGSTDPRKTTSNKDLP